MQTTLKQIEMHKLVEKFRFDDAICFYLKTVNLPVSSENLEIYKEKIKNKEELADCLIEYWKTQGELPIKNRYMYHAIKVF